MPWWGWLALGAVLLGAEIAVQTEFGLFTIGAAAMGLGRALRLVAGPAASLQWIVVAVLAVTFNLLFRRQLHERLIGQPPALDPELVGESGVGLAAIAPGAQ